MNKRYKKIEPDDLSTGNLCFENEILKNCAGALFQEEVSNTLSLFVGGLGGTSYTMFEMEKRIQDLSKQVNLLEEVVKSLLVENELLSDINEKLRKKVGS